MLSAQECVDAGALESAVVGITDLQIALHRVWASLGAPIPPLQADAFLVLMHELLGCNEDAVRICMAVSKLRVGPFIWPVLGACNSAAPALLMLHAVRHMLASEDRALYTALTREGVLDDVVDRWLQGSLLRVLPLNACAQVAVLSVVCGPLVAPALVVAALSIASADVLQHVLAGDLLPWVVGLTFADMDTGVLLADARRIEAAHRSHLLPLLLHNVT